MPTDISSPNLRPAEQRKAAHAIAVDVQRSDAWPSGNATRGKPPCGWPRVDDIEAVTAHLVAHGVKMLGDEMDYVSRRLRFFEGPEKITLELVQWVEPDPPGRPRPGAHEGAHRREN